MVSIAKSLGGHVESLTSSAEGLTARVGRLEQYIGPYSVGDMAPAVGVGTIGAGLYGLASRVERIELQFDQYSFDSITSRLGDVE